MAGEDAVLGVVIARGGSKGLPGKNLRPLGGRPLVCWSVAAALEATTLDRHVVSTDCPAIAEAARRAGGDVPFLRPAELATDDAPVEAVIEHALASLPETYQKVVLLQAASPFRRGVDIDDGVRLLRQTGAPSCVSVTPTSKHPAWTFTLGEDRRLLPFIPQRPATTRRQDLPPAYVPNGAVYAADIGWLRRTGRFYAPETIGWAMPPERSVDIDVELDFRWAEFLLSQEA